MNDGSEESAALDKIAGDLATQQEWEKVIKLCPDSNAILDTILESYRLAPWNKRIRSIEQDEADHYGRLELAAKSLIAHYSKIPNVGIAVTKMTLSADGSVKTSGPTKDDSLTRKRNDLLAHLKWMADDLESQSQFRRNLNQDAFPQGQKKNQEGSERFTFCVNLGLKFDFFFR